MKNVVVRTGQAPELTKEGFNKWSPSYLHRDWNGSETTMKPGYELHLDRGVLHFLVEFPVSHQEVFSAGFTEGLWREEVGEIFLRGDKEEYIELHIAPGPRWWGALFTRYREQARELTEIQPEVGGRVVNNTFFGKLSISLSDLRRAGLDINSSTGVHVSFILKDPNPVYFSSSPITGGKPDFHRADLFHDGCFEDTVSG